MASVEDLSSRYGSQLRQLKSIFPTWDEGDLAFTLQDVKGNVDEAAMMITEGESMLCRDPDPADQVFLSAPHPISKRLLLPNIYRPSNPVHGSTFKEKDCQASTQGHDFEALEPQCRYWRMGGFDWR
jgi:hypothetical protein